MKRIHVNIDYDEGISGSYRAVTVGTFYGTKTRFETGNPVVDWQAAVAFAREEAGNDGVMMTGSSVDHFVMDDDAWRFVLDESGREILVAEDRWPVGTFGMAPS